MKVFLVTMALCFGLAAAPEDDIGATYDRFVSAQNARDLATVRELLLDVPQVLWVTDGHSVWGRDAMLARMASFQTAEIWQAIPDRAHGAIVEVSPGVAYLHLPLTLRIGTRAQGTSDTHFLVSILFVRRAETWRIAALFTTLQNLSG